MPSFGEFYSKFLLRRKFDMNSSTLVDVKLVLSCSVENSPCSTVQPTQSARDTVLSPETGMGKGWVNATSLVYVQDGFFLFFKTSKYRWK